MVLAPEMGGVDSAISHDHSYLGGSACTLQDTIEEIESGEGEDEDEDDDNA